MKKYALFAFLLLSTTTAMAADAPVIMVKDSNTVCVDGVKGEVCHHARAGGKMTVTLDTEGCREISARLVQLSTRLEAPVDGAVQPAETKACGSQDFIVTLPAATAETEFEVQLLAQEDKRWQPLKEIGVMAYPDTMLDSVKSWAANKKNALVVTDKDGDFTAFLDRQKIEYYTAATTPRDVAVAKITVGEPEENEKPEASTLYLEEKSKGLTKIKSVERNGITTVRAQVKMIGSLSAGEPLAEKEFAELFGMIVK